MSRGGKREGAGRPPGSRNRRTLAVLDRLPEDYCPIEELARIALDKATPLQVRVDCHKTIASYTLPKVKPFEAMAYERTNGIDNDPFGLGI